MQPPTWPLTVIDTSESSNVRESGSNSVMQVTDTFSAENKRSSCTWKIFAHFRTSEHLMLTSVGSLQYSQEYIRNVLIRRLHHMQKNENSMNSITLLSFAYPRQLRSHAEVPVIVILHFSKSVGFPTIHAYLGCGTIGISVICTPVDLGEGKYCPDVTLHPIFPTFLQDICMIHVYTSTYLHFIANSYLDIFGVIVL